MFKTTIIQTTDIELDIIAIPGSKTKAYRVVHNTTFSPERKDAGERRVEQQGIVRKPKEITALRQGFFGVNHGFAVFSDDSLKTINDFGYAGLYENRFEEFDASPTHYDYIVGGGDPTNIVRFETHDHSFWDINDEIIPTGIHFDYICANMVDRVYDIRKAIDILIARDDVRLVEASDYNRKTLAERIIQKPDNAAQQVPYYNSDAGYSCLEFFWTPSKEQATILQKARNKFETVFNNDWLGLRAGGAAKYDTFWGSDERASETCDDDCSCC